MEPDSSVQTAETLIMLLQPPADDVKIEVSDAINRGYGLTEYVGYIIKVTSPTAITCERRYRQFAALRDVMVIKWPGVMIPVLPKKYMSGSNSLKVVNERKKYLTYFLNCVAKVKYLYESEEFQYFLKTNDSDLQKYYQREEKDTYQLMLERYQTSFPDLKFDEQKRNDFILRARAAIDPFAKQMQECKIPLINISDQVEKLAIKRENYVLNLRILYNETLPNLQKQIKESGETGQFFFTNQSNSKIREQAGELKYENNGKNYYWLLYEALKLQIQESDAVLQAINRKRQVERDEDRIRNKIASNNEDLESIKLNKFSLKNLFNRNTQELTIKIEIDNEKQIKELAALEKFIFYVNLVVQKTIITQYREKRMRIWRDVWNRFLKNQIKFNDLVIEFYELIMN